jgi:hypothetical protein
MVDHGGREHSATHRIIDRENKKLLADRETVNQQEAL